MIVRRNIGGVQFEHLRMKAGKVWNILCVFHTRSTKSHKTQRHNELTFILLLDNNRSACSNIGSIISVPDTTNLETHISALGNSSAAGEKSIIVPHQSRYALKDSSILIANLKTAPHMPSRKGIHFTKSSSPPPSLCFQPFLPARA